MTFKAIDQTATDSDLPYSAALAQGLRGNVLAGRDDRLRGMCKVYETRVDGSSLPINMPRLIGTYAWNDDEKRVHTMVPFVYIRTRPEVSEIEVVFVGDQVVASGTISAVVITMRDAMLGTFAGLDDIDNMPNASTSGPAVGTDVEVAFTGVSALTLPSNDTDLFMVFACSKSSLSGTITEIKDASATISPDINATGGRLTVGGAVIKYNADIPHTEITQRPGFAVGFNDGTDKKSWPGNDGPSAHQAIFVDDDSNWKGIYVYPPFRFNTALGVDPLLHLMKKDLSYFDLKCVNITESATVPFILDSALNGGKPAAVETHSQIVVESEKVNLLHTPVFHCGGSVAPTPDSLLLSGRGVLNKLHNWVEYTAAWQTIGACPVRPHGKHKNYGETQQTRVGYRVAGVIALSAGVGYDRDVDGRGGATVTLPGAQFRVNLRLRLTDRDDSTNEVLGDTEAQGFVHANTFPVAQLAILAHASFEPIGYLLRMHHIIQYDGQSTNNLISHSLLGQFPEDVWARGNYLFFDTVLTDTTAVETPVGAVPARLLSVQIMGDAADVPSAATFGDASSVPKAYAHLLTWTCVGATVQRPGVIDEVSI